MNFSSKIVGSKHALKCSGLHCIDISGNYASYGCMQLQCMVGGDGPGAGPVVMCGRRRIVSLYHWTEGRRLESVAFPLAWNRTYYTRRSEMDRSSST
jgi:hypothetical protein